MTIFKLVMAFVLFIAISDKMLFQNFLSGFQGGTPNFLSVEKFVHDIVNIAKIVSTSCSVSISVGVIFVQIALMMAAALAVLFVVKVCSGWAESNTTNVELRSASSVVFATNNIYLQTSKFIC